MRLVDMPDEELESLVTSRALSPDARLKWLRDNVGVARKLHSKDVRTVRDALAALGHRTARPSAFRRMV